MCVCVCVCVCKMLYVCVCVYISVNSFFFKVNEFYNVKTTDHSYEDYDRIILHGLELPYLL